MEETKTDPLYSLNEVHADVRRALVDTYDMRELTSDFRALASNAERVYFAYDILKKHNLLPTIINVEKCDEKSEERRKYGNHVFAALKRDHVAMKHYNKSVAYAKSQETLALAYANRSAILFENGLYEECIKDIDNAFKNNYPGNLEQKLLDRKQKSEEQIADSESKKHEPYFTPAPTIVGGVNKKFECASDCIEMQQTDIMGRHIVATQNINPGEVIAVENPYTQVLLYEFYLTHCHNCLHISYNLIPCVRCPLTLYCSEDCRDAAWERYHRYECPLLDTLHSIDATKLQLLALRVVLCARNEFSQFLKDDEVNDESDIYKSASYKEIHYLVTNEEHRPVNDLFARSTVAAVLLHLLEATSFFDDFIEDELDSMKKCVAGLLLRHLQTTPSNMHEISELQGSADKGYDNIGVGAGAYAFMSLLNHSCSPNVVRHCHGTTMVLRALRPIQAGVQLYDNYGYHHALMVRDERRTHLKEQYWFTCECEACVNDWPLYHNLPAGDVISVITENDLNSLTSGNREVAELLMPQFAENAKVLDKTEPKRYTEILDTQEILKQCFAICGNKHTIF